MPDDLASHRRFHIYAAPGEGAGADDPAALTDEEADKAVIAYTWPGLTEVRLFPREEFAKYATPFEHAYSSLLGQGKRPAAPVVDETGEVIMYVGWLDWKDFVVASDMGAELESERGDVLTDAGKGDVWKFQISISSHGTLEPGMAYAFRPETVVLVLTTTDGTVIQILDQTIGAYGDMSSFQPGDFLAGWIAGAIRRLGLLALDYLAAENTLAELGTSQLVGQVSADEMEIHLTRVLGNREELRRLMAARVLSGDRLRTEVRGILDQWAQRYGKTIELRSTEGMKQVTSASNLMAPQPANVRNILMINRVLLDPGFERNFFEETVHELVADALGWSGSGGADTIAFVGAEYSPANNAQFLLEGAIKVGRSVREAVDALR